MNINAGTDPQVIQQVLVPVGFYQLNVFIDDQF
jgi:hypothetical protein